MEVKVLYFGGLRELTGKAEEAIHVSGSAPSVSNALDVLCETHVGLSQHLATLRAAVDEEFVEPSHALSEGCTLALIPPVSGG